MEKFGTVKDGVLHVPITHSSFINGIDYDRNKSTIWVHIFNRRGSVRSYWYDNKSWDEARDFITAMSAGSHYNAHLKGQLGSFKDVHSFLKRGKSTARGIGKKLAGGLRRFGAGLKTLR